MIIGEEWINDGFRHSIEYFLSHGYTKAELYGSMWGYADLDHEFNLQHDTEWVLYIRKFIEAVLDYTGAQKVDVITHSMGVTLGRAAIKGGIFEIGENQPAYIGNPINNKIRTFIGIAGANYGVSICSMDIYFDAFRICNKENGYYPGLDAKSKKQPKDISKFLKRLNDNRMKEGDNVYSMLSLYDEVIPAYSHHRLTGEWPTIDQTLIYDSAEYTHLGVRDLTVHDQYALITNNYSEKAVEPQTNFEDDIEETKPFLA